MKKRSFIIGALTDEGNVKVINEDSILVKTGENEYGEFGMFAIADGMGGMYDGDVASSIAICELKNWWNTKLFSVLSKPENHIENIVRDICYTIEQINRRIIAYGNEKQKRVGTTLSILFIYNDKAIVIHIGDSRIYKLSINNLIQLTEDHSWVAEQIRKGKITEKEAKNHEKRHLLLKCLGVYKSIELSYSTFNIEKDDTFILCSDGFYNYIGDSELISSINSKGQNEYQLQESISNLLKIIKSRQAHDNISVIIVKQSKDEEKVTALSKLKNYFMV